MTGAVPPLRLKQHGPQRGVVAGAGAGCRIRKRPDEGRGLPAHAGPAQPAVKLGVLNGSRTGLRLGMPPLQFEQHGRQQNVIRDASHAGGFGNRADEGRRVAALRRPAYANPHDGEHRYSPAEVVDAVPVPQWGEPDLNRICTSHVERQNLSIRMGMRRMTRLTNAFSKKWENLKAAYAVWLAFYDFCRVHQTLRVTPAMEAGITDHVWEVHELLTAPA